MEVEISPEPPQGWDEFVSNHRQGSAYLRSAAIGVGRDVFGLRTRFLLARRDDGGVAGVLPLVEQASWYLGRYLISLPFVTYGGMLVADAGASAALTKAAVSEAASRRVSHVELRHVAVPPGLDLPARTDKVSMVMSLPTDEDALFKSFPAKLRSQVRRGRRGSPRVLWGGAELLDDFYRIFCQTMHALGTPVYPRRFFTAMLAALSEDAAVCVLRDDDGALAAAITIRHGRRVEVTWAGATDWAKRNSVNMLMYWELFRRAIADGAAEFDFGRTTPGSGTWKFKKQWGAEPLQLHWHYWLADGGELPVLNHSNPKYELAIRLWRRMPLALANRLGPLISRNLP